MGNLDWGKRKEEEKRKRVLCFCFFVILVRERKKEERERKERRKPGEEAKAMERRAGPGNEQRLYTSSGFSVRRKNVPSLYRPMLACTRSFPFPFNGSHSPTLDFFFSFFFCLFVFFCCLFFFLNRFLDFFFFCLLQLSYVPQWISHIYLFFIFLLNIFYLYKYRLMRF